MDHPKSGFVRISDPHCIQMLFFASYTEQEPSNMFGFKMPDNFDLPEDFFSQIRSSAKAMPEPNETVNDDPMVRHF